MPIIGISNRDLAEDKEENEIPNSQKNSGFPLGLPDVGNAFYFCSISGYGNAQNRDWS